MAFSSAVEEGRARMLRHAPIALAISLLVGCGGGSAKPDGGGTGGGSLGGTGLAVDGGGGGGGSAGTTGTVTPTGSLAFQGTQAVLLDLGPPCTGEDGATGDRWCGFFGPSAVTPGNAALFVVNVTKVAAGTSVNCAAAADPNCLKLTDAFGENDSHPSLFQGDTLVYYDIGTAEPFGWRPGMTAGKRLATLDADADAVCTPAIKGTAISCLRLLPMAMQTDPTNIVLVDVLAGHLEGAANPPLVKVETVIAASINDTNVSHLQVGFPVPGAETIAWSARSSAAGPEVLKMQTMGNDASRVTVASGVNQWDVSPDGARWYWLANVNDDTFIGALQSAPFPAGTSPVAIASNVAQYAFPTPTSLAVVDTAEAMTVFTSAAGAPAGAQAFDSSVFGFLSPSSDGHLAYVKTVTTDSSGNITGSDMFVKKFDATQGCTLTSATDSFPFDFSFTTNSVGAAWVQKTIVSANARYTRFSDCMTMTVGSSIVFTESLGNRGILFLNGFSSTTGLATMNLRGLDSAGALTADPTTVISSQVGSLWPVTSGTTDIVVYSVNGGGTTDGIYVRPFGP
jgi:hypothetical protein